MLRRGKALVLAVFGYGRERNWPGRSVGPRIHSDDQMTRVTDAIFTNPTRKFRVKLATQGRPSGRPVLTAVETVKIFFHHRLCSIVCNNYTQLTAHTYEQN